jgi:hypothetical protein
MSSHKLILAPLDPDWAPADAAAMVSLAERLVLASAPYAPGREDEHPPGPRSIAPIGERGAARLDVRDPARRGVVASIGEVAVVGPLATAECLASGLTSALHCPGCGHEDDWGPPVGAWYEDHDTRWQCPACGRSYRVPELDWRHENGFARAWLELVHVGERDLADPGALAAALRADTGVDWTWIRWRM